MIWIAFLTDIHKDLPQKLYNWDFVHSELDRQRKEKPHLCKTFYDKNQNYDVFDIDQRYENNNLILTGGMRTKMKKAPAIFQVGQFI